MDDMTNEEAIKLVCEYMRNDYGEEKIRIAKNMAIEALEKQIPKMVPREYDDEFICPSCGKTTEDYNVAYLRFCPECGQKLKWKD